MTVQILDEQFIALVDLGPLGQSTTPVVLALLDEDKAAHQLSDDLESAAKYGT